MLTRALVRPWRWRRLRTPPRTARATARPGGRRSWALGLALLAAVGSGTWLIYDGSQTQQPPQPSANDAFARPAAAIASNAPVNATPPHPRGVKALAASAPVRIKIPAIQVNAPITPLGLDSSGRPQAPDGSNQNLAGWLRGGTTPGAAGNAIMDGHVDTEQGPAVFYNLGSLHKGNTVEIDRKDHTAALFTVDAIEVYEKNAFPSTQVYGPTKNPQLRLITCGGGYSEDTGYLGNVVLYAHLTGSRQIGKKPKARRR
ncbi:class F sortase [Streptacidiphilus sp. PAMC 29251]